jgi:hypothetical protein
MVVVSISFVTAHVVADPVPTRDTVFAGHDEHDKRSDVVNERTSELLMTFEMSALHAATF